jgi:DNA-binding NarL/FixJ family response regulator
MEDRDGDKVTAPELIRILVVDDHPLIRKGIVGLVADQPDMQVVAEAANGREAIELYRAHRPSLTLMDLQMPELAGIDAVLAIRNEFSDAAIIVLTTHAGDAHVFRALQAGARGYLLKNTLHKELLDSVRAVHAGKKALSAQLSIELAENALREALTPSEIAVLRFVAEGSSNKQIARRLGLTEDTIKNRIKSILSKLQAEDRTHAAMIAIKRGVIDI